MIYLLDTNACIVYLNRPSSGVQQKLQSLSPQDIAICSVVKAELFYGAMRSNNPTRTLALQEAFLNTAGNGEQGTGNRFESLLVYGFFF